MLRPLCAACLFVSSLPAAAVDENKSVTNVRVTRESENWPSLMVSPSLGFGLPHSVAFSGRIETNGLVPFLYTDTLLRLSFDPFGTTPASFALPPAMVYPTTGLRQRIGFALQGTQIDKVPIITAGKYSNGVQATTEDGERKELLQESFEVEQPTQTSDVLFASADLRPFASATGPYAVLGVGYTHMARFVGDISYTIRGRDVVDHIVSYTQWTVEPRVLLGVANVPFSPGIAGTFVYQPFDLFALAGELAVYNRNAFDFAEVNGQGPFIGEFLFEVTLPFAIDPAGLMKLVAPATGASEAPPTASSEPAAASMPASEAAPSTESGVSPPEVPHTSPSTP